MIVLWLEIHYFSLRCFLLFNLITSAGTQYNVSVFKPTIHDLHNSNNWNTKFFYHARRTFDLKEDKLELEHHNKNLMMMRDLGFVHEDICRNLEIIPGFHLHITEIN